MAKKEIYSPEEPVKKKEIDLLELKCFNVLCVSKEDICSPEEPVEEGEIDLLVEFLELALHHHVALAISSLPHILNSRHTHVSRNPQNCKIPPVLRVQIRCFFDAWIRDPDPGLEKNPDPG